MRYSIALVLLFSAACGGHVDEGPVSEWQPVSVIKLTEVDECWRIDGPEMATSSVTADPRDVSPGPKVWPGGAEILVWSRDGLAEIHKLNHTLVACP